MSGPDGLESCDSRGGFRSGRGFRDRNQALSKEAHMADVIPFALWRRYQPRTCAFPRESAEILFFTGVRYERPAEPAAPPITTPRGRRPASGNAIGRGKARQPA
jgi:hypothetical protein